MGHLKIGRLGHNMNITRRNIVKLEGDSKKGLFDCTIIAENAANMSGGSDKRARGLKKNFIGVVASCVP